jgi:hypothetical protein
MQRGVEQGLIRHDSVSGQPHASATDSANLSLTKMPTLAPQRTHAFGSHVAWLAALAYLGCGGSAADPTDLTPPGGATVSAAQSTVAVDVETLVPGALAAVTVVPRSPQGMRIGAGLTVTLGASGGTATGSFTTPTYEPSDSSYRSRFTALTPGTTLALAVRVNGTLLTSAPTLTVTTGTPATPISADVEMQIDGSKTFPISRYIYGGNFIDQTENWTGGTPPSEMTFNRMGGNRLTAYNWETNFSNAGFDFNWQNDRYLSQSTTPGDAVRKHASRSFSKNQAFMATIPMIGYVAANDCTCDVGATDADRDARLARHFFESKPAKGSAFATSPDKNDRVVYQDEFVNWFESNWPGRASHSTAPVFYSLDNEPDIWHVTHREINSNIGESWSTPRLQTYTGFIETTIAYSRAIKAVSPNALIFGGAVATYTGVANLGRYPHADPVFGTQNFYDVYLARLKAAEATHGRRLVDVLDLHYYPAISTTGGEITNDYAPQDSATIWARVQGPRSLWDPTFNEKSWVNNYLGTPIRLLPRVKAQIATHYPGTKLAITEYYFGRGGDISGGVAQADVLGIFGREGVFAAALWPIAGVYSLPYRGDGEKAYAFIFGAFRMFLNYDGDGGRFGETGLGATASNAEASSVYASRDAEGRVVLIVINKMQSPKAANISLRNAGTFTSARAYTLTSDSPKPTKQPDLAISGGSALTITMPALSVMTIVLTP